MLQLAKLQLVMMGSESEHRFSFQLLKPPIQLLVNVSVKAVEDGQELGTRNSQDTWMELDPRIWLSSALAIEAV